MTKRDYVLEKAALIAVEVVNSRKVVRRPDEVAHYATEVAAAIWDATQEVMQEQNTVSTVSANQPCTDCKHIYASADQPPCTLCTTSRPSKWEKAP